jgi:two-component system NarL family response regulator
MKTSAIRVLCVDDHPMVLEGLVAMIDRQPDMQVVGTAASGSQAIQLFRKHRPDVTLMDLRLPGVTGIEAITAIRSEFPESRIVVLTIFQGEEDIHRALKAGAATYVLKDVRSHELVRIMREVHEGRQPMPPSVAALLASREEREVLTERQVEVLHLLAKGLHNKAIAKALGITHETAKVHVKNILAKFGVSDRMAAVKIALQRGIIHVR